MNSLLDRAQVQFARRYRQLRHIWKAEGPRGISHRTRTAVARWLAPKDVVMPVRPADIVAVDLFQSLRVVVPTTSPGQPVFINWVTTPPSPGAGGHTTLYRIVRYLEAHGYVNRVYFYDVHHVDHQYYESIVRRSYQFNGRLASLDGGMDNAHAVVATSWPTAYPAFNARCAGKRFYFVQDFEPYFYPVGASSVLAENTSRMGFHAITAGRWLAEKLRTEFCMEADYLYDFR